MGSELGKQKPCANPIVPFRQVSVFWRIENFRLSEYKWNVKSAPFNLRCGAKEESAPKFYLEYNRPSPPYHVHHLLELKAVEDQANGSGGVALPHMKFSYSALLANGGYQMFHDKGVVRNGLEVEKTTGCYSFHETKESCLPHDSLTFLVQFTSCCEPVFEVERLFALTRVPTKDVAFEWKIDDLSKGKYETSVPDLPLELQLQTALEGGYEIGVLQRDRFSPCPAVTNVFLRKDSGEAIAIKEFGLIRNDPEVCVLPKDVCEKHVEEALQENAGLRLCFEFRAADGTPVSEDFGETPFAGHVDVNEMLKPPPQTDQYLASRNKLEALFSMPVIEDCVDDGNTKDLPVDSISELKMPMARCPGNSAGDRRDADAGPAFPTEIISDLKTLYSQHIFSDCSLRVGGSSFPVHRGILSARSVVFRAMFEADMSEKKEDATVRTPLFVSYDKSSDVDVLNATSESVVDTPGCFEETDVDADTMDRLLRFVYYNDFGDDLDADAASRLFAAADKYRIESLKSRCVESLAGSLSAENVCRALSLADERGEQALMARAKEFALANSQRVFCSKEWMRFMAEKRMLAGGIMQEDLLKQQS